jgi:D-alanyl-D-alanine carboxypeptidase/D-alanyl-D-alanine-endopeptidase (penicillin-binding protein 4)
MPPLTDRRQIILGLVLTIGLLVAACSSEPNQGSDPGIVESTTPPRSSLASSNPPDPIKAVMSKPRYRNATWSLLATDMKTGQSFYSFNADQMSFTGSTRKLFSVGTALNGLGADHRETTSVYELEASMERASSTEIWCWQPEAILPSGGVDQRHTVQVTDFDYGDANALRAAQFTPQDPLDAVDQLAAQVKASAIQLSMRRRHRRPLLSALPGTQRQPAHHPHARHREPRRRHHHPPPSRASRASRRTSSTGRRPRPSPSKAP